MTDPGLGGFPPPPGWQPPKPPPRSYLDGPNSPVATAPAPAPGAWTPPPGMLGAAHKPGAMPLRPLTLGDMYDAAFRIIRFNPKATVGSAVLVAAISMTLPILVTAILTASVDVTIDQAGGPSDESLVGFVGSFGSFLVGIVLFAFGNLLVTGMIAHVVSAAAIGKRLGLGEAWAATRGRRWRLLGLALLLWGVWLLVTGIYVAAWIGVALSAPTALIVVWGLVTVPAYIVFMFFYAIRVYLLSVPALMLEQVSIVGAVRRGYRLTSRQFWRSFGIWLLTAIVVGIASQVIAFPIALVGQIGLLTGGQYALLLYVGSQALAQVVTSAFATPYTAAVTSMQYIDQRMRKEAYDVELMTQAGLTG